MDQSNNNVCKKCGAVLQEGDKVCKSCGSIVLDQNTNTEQVNPGPVETEPVENPDLEYSQRIIVIDSDLPEENKEEVSVEKVVIPDSNVESNEPIEPEVEVTEQVNEVTEPVNEEVISESQNNEVVTNENNTEQVESTEPTVTDEITVPPVDNNLQNSVTNPEETKKKNMKRILGAVGLCVILVVVALLLILGKLKGTPEKKFCKDIQSSVDKYKQDLITYDEINSDIEVLYSKYCTNRDSAFCSNIRSEIEYYDLWNSTDHDCSVYDVNTSDGKASKEVCESLIEAHDNQVNNKGLLVSLDAYCSSIK